MEKEDTEASERVRNYLQRHRLSRYAAELTYRAFAYTALLARDPGLLKELKDPECIAGMIEGAMVAPRLCHPNDTDGSLVYKHATGGQYLAYDFNRDKEFPISSTKPGFTKESVGKLSAVLLQDIVEQPAQHRTPTSSFNPLVFGHMLTFNTYTAEELVEHGVVERKTQAEAYETVGLTGQISELRSRSVANDIVWQVTPKGNGLIGLLEDGGDPTPKTSPQFKFAKIPGLLAH